MPRSSCLFSFYSASTSIMGRRLGSATSKADSSQAAGGLAGGGLAGGLVADENPPKATRRVAGNEPGARHRRRPRKPSRIVRAPRRGAGISRGGLRPPIHPAGTQPHHSCRTERRCACPLLISRNPPGLTGRWHQPATHPPPSPISQGILHPASARNPANGGIHRSGGAAYL